MTGNKKLAIKYSLRENWWKVLILFAVFAIATGITAESKLKIKDEESIEVFIEGDLIDKEFNNKMLEKLTSPNILEVSTTAVAKNNEYFYTLLKSVVSICSDILVLDYDVLKDTGDVCYTTYNSYTASEKEYLDARYSSLEEFTISNKFAGYKIYDKDNSAYNANFNFSKYFTFTETSYLIIDKTSTNLKTIHPSGYSDTFMAFCAFLDIYK